MTFDQERHELGQRLFQEVTGQPAPTAASTPFMEMTVDHVHEEIQLLAMDCSTMLFESLTLIPEWRDYYLAHDQTPHYRYLRTMLQALQQFGRSALQGATLLR